MKNPNMGGSRYILPVAAVIALGGIASTACKAPIDPYEHTTVAALAPRMKSVSACPKDGDTPKQFRLSPVVLQHLGTTGQGTETKAYYTATDPDGSAASLLVQTGADVGIGKDPNKNQQVANRLADIAGRTVVGKNQAGNNVCLFQIDDLRAVDPSSVVPAPRAQIAPLAPPE